jgi:ornithine cyclodeaminase/alanine dehydrogenase-like protein (mu-crystallin family)
MDVAEMEYSHPIYLTRACGAGYSSRTMKLLTVAAHDLPKVLPMRDAVEAMKFAFAELSAGRVVAPQRAVVEVDEVDGISLLMGGYVPGEGLAAKTVSIFNRNRELGKDVVTGLVLVLDPVSGEPIGLLDGGALTAWRTGAAVGAATDLLARPDARIGALIGAGVQARTQLLALDAVREMETIRVFGLDQSQVSEFIERLQPDVSARLEPVASAEEAVDGAHVISSATNSPTPVFDGRRLASGVHLNAIGTFTLDRREVDLVTVERATVFVDLVEAALEEAGELVAGIEAGVTRSEDWTEIGDVVAERSPGRTRVDQITFFKSVGHAAQDVVTASRVMKRAVETGLARTVEL